MFPAGVEDKMKAWGWIQTACPGAGFQHTQSDFKWFFHAEEAYSASPDF